ncbi:MAG: peptidyl-alpha-hydroxyglycine alpha-amidating lyase family protein, partial [Dehalococcoidia bacterium]
EVSGVAVDSKDNVYAFTRGVHPVLVFDRQGSFLRSWGEGLFSRPHGIHIGTDDFVFCVDDGNHTVRKFTPEGRLVMTIGSERQPSPKWGGKPFNRPTHVAVSPTTGELYITDGYGNSRVHKYTPDGRYLFSWGEPGIDPGQFICPHNVVVDEDENVYTADRESHRIQVFNAKGQLQAIWQNIHRPDGICMDGEGNFYIGELGPIPGLDDCPGLGHRLSIYNLDGKLLTRFGDPEEGEGPGQFIAPHGVAVDSRGDLYVGETSYTIRGSHMDPPKELRSFQKFIRKG